MPNGRCRMHGGASTGPRTPEGLERSRKARWKTGKFSAEAKAERRILRTSMRVLYATGVLTPQPPSRARKPYPWELDELEAWHTPHQSTRTRSGS
jgi:hypothetical protein